MMKMKSFAASAFAGLVVSSAFLSPVFAVNTPAPHPSTDPAIQAQVQNDQSNQMNNTMDHQNNNNNINTNLTPEDANPDTATGDDDY